MSARTVHPRYDPCLPKSSKKASGRSGWVHEIKHAGFPIIAQHGSASTWPIIYRHARALGCEGIVSKRLGLPNRSGRMSHWLKVKNPRAPAGHAEGRGGLVVRSGHLVVLVRCQHCGHTCFEAQIFGKRAIIIEGGPDELVASGLTKRLPGLAGKDIPIRLSRQLTP